MADVAIPAFKKRPNKASNIRKRPATPPPSQGADSDSDNTDDEQGVTVKRRKTEGVTVSSEVHKAPTDLSKSTAFAADRSAKIAANEDATKTSSWYHDSAIVATAANTSTNAKPTATESGTGGSGTYKGSSQYSTFIQKHPDAPSRHVGPVKAPTNVRTITVTDFAPDVCKDYKQTGFCGFGDGCKFLHAREDYKQGWQLDKEWENVGKNKDRKPGAAPRDEPTDEEGKMLESIPFKCIICKDDYQRPVVTRCGHYFCERCAMTRYMKEKKKACANCGKDTNGTFNVAKKLNELLEKKKRRAEERKERAREAGEEVSKADED